MSRRIIFQFLTIFGFFFNSGLFADPQGPLKESDIQKIMKQIFSQHVEKKEISQNIIKNSFKVYIDQFDPERIYLLEDEVREYLSLDDETVAKILEQYQHNDYSAYTKLNKIIQNAIIRARSYRKKLESNPGQLFKPIAVGHTAQEEEWRDAEFRKLFAKTPSELIERIKHDIIQAITAEKKRFGDQLVLADQAKTLELYEKDIRAFESQYLTTNENGEKASTAEEENLFVIHVLKALANSLDSHTKFYNTSEAYNLRMRLEKEMDGVGVMLRPGVDGAVVTGLVENAPAAKSGQINVYDKIIEINGQPITGQTFEKVLELLRGQSGSSISLTLKRTVAENGKQVDKLVKVNLKREPIQMSEGRVTSSFEKFGNGIIGKITLPMFYQNDQGINSETDVREAIKALNKEGNLRGLILDLRENSGGFLSQAIKVTGLFITSGVVVISKYSSGEEKVYRDMDGKVAYDGPLVVLTSKETASAAEIVAQALQDYGVALIVGDEQTYGKGSIQSQTVTENGNSSFFKVTVGKYYTVGGHTPQIVGVKADIVVPGEHSQEQVGEEYLEYTLSPDDIPSAFSDKLVDIEPGLRAWYLQHYTPTLQSQKNNWKNMLTLLKKNSEYRIKNNKNYQSFLKQSGGVSALTNEGVSEEEDDESEEFTLKSQGGKNNFGKSDLQMTEATNIIKDMILIESYNRGNASKSVLKQ